MLSAKKKLEAKRKRIEKKNAKKEKKAAKKNGVEMSPPVQEGEPENQQQGNIAIIDMDAEPDPSIPRAIILDLTPVNFLDTVGVKTLSRIRRDYGDVGIEVLLAGCQSGVVENLQTGGFFNDKVTKSCLFYTVHDAVLHCQSPKPEIQEETGGTYF